MLAKTTAAHKTDMNFFLCFSKNSNMPTAPFRALYSRMHTLPINKVNVVDFVGKADFGPYMFIVSSAGMILQNLPGRL